MARVNALVTVIGYCQASACCQRLLTNTPAEMKAFVALEVDKWVKVARDSGAKAD